jgi:hypothetical protein
MVEVKDMRQLFELALKIEPPWRVADFQFDWERKRVDLGPVTLARLLPGLDSAGQAAAVAAGRAEYEQT